MSSDLDPQPRRFVDNLPSPIRVLLLADSHLGFDLPARPRVDRRRRGHDFLANHQQALVPALHGRVDMVVHGGDVFHRPQVAPSLVFQAFKPLLQIADSGIPVFVVPGNHERSRIPHPRFACHPNLHIFREPCTQVLRVRGHRVAVSGFPYERRRVRENFPNILEDTDWHLQPAEVRLLCIHHCVEGATVGPSDYTFRDAKDVIRCDDLPHEFAAVLSGHIHRHQVLRQTLNGCPLPSPVLYPGSVERTAFAEMNEEKGTVILDLEPNGSGGSLLRHEFLPLPSRPMLIRDLVPEASAGASWRASDLLAQVKKCLTAAPRDSVFRIRIHGPVPPESRRVVSASHLRSISPPEMNLEVLLAEDREGRRVGRKGKRSPAKPTGRYDAPTVSKSAQQCLDL